MIKFPHKIVTPSGHVAIVTNPENGHYHFEETAKGGGSYSFDWFDDSFTGNNKGIGIGSAPAWKDQYEILQKFLFDQNN